MQSPRKDALVAMERASSKASFLDSLTIVLKLLTNIINDPVNPKYRSFKLENKTIKEKVLAIAGMKQFLIDLGFQESAGSLNLGVNVLINDLRINRDIIQSVYDRLSKTPADAGSSQNQEVVKSVPGRPRFHGKYSGHKRVTLPQSSHPFLANIDAILHQVLSYEDAALQEFGKSFIPVEKLKEETLERIREIQKSSKTDPVYEDLFLVLFTEWFNRSFFTWVNQVPCKVCGSEEAKRQSSYIENGIRVTEIFCCNRPTKFYRYNDIPTLLVTRRGRCGEYANCFTFLCRCLGYDARYVFATFDHVWTEVYSPFQKRWIHVDPSDNVVDSPLMYQHGWKRDVDYILSFSRFDVSDVTWRYSNEDRQALQKRRNKVPEELLEAKLLSIYKALQKDLTRPKRDFLFKRMLLDSIQMLQRREPTVDERKGRSSGDLQWRSMRGEHSVDAFYVFKLSEEEATKKELNFRYSATKDVYESFLKDASGNAKILSSSKSWNSRIYSSKNIFRKEEHDWKMVYLARTEDTDEAVIEWKIDAADKGLRIKEMQVKFETKVYENAEVKLEFLLDNAKRVTDVQSVKDCSSVVIRAILSGGKGDNAWQHSQLFRQEMKSTEFPFQVNVKFH